MESIMWQGFRHFGEKQVLCFDETDYIGVLYIDLIHFSRLTRVYGEDAAQSVLHLAGRQLQVLANHLQEQSVFRASSHYVWDDCFAVLLSFKSMNDVQDHSRVAIQLVRELEAYLNQNKPASIKAEELKFRYGFQTVAAAEFRNAESVTAALYQIFIQASHQAKQSSGTLPVSDMLEFDEIILNRKVTTLFQPILDLNNWTVFGYEALSRGPQGTSFYYPDHLLYTAEKMGSLFALEQVMREKALENFGMQLQCPEFLEMDRMPCLTINIHPQTIYDPMFISGQTMKLVHRYGIRPEQIIIEITEHQAIKDYSAFLESINHYRKQGYQIAIDDTGAGYAGLQMIVELMPDFIKLDMSLSRGIEQNPKKQIMVETMVNLSYKLGSKLISEGIETPEELAVIQSLGVPFGQGYLLGRPKPLFTKAETGLGLIGV